MAMAMSVPTIIWHNIYLISFCSLALSGMCGVSHLRDLLECSNGFQQIINLVSVLHSWCGHACPKYHIGEYEPTLLRSFIRAARLRYWLASPGRSTAILQCKNLLDKLLPDTSPANSMPDNSSDIPSQSGITSELAGLKLGGVLYNRSSTHLGNSLIRFYPFGNQKLSPVVGQIKSIHTRDGRSFFNIHRQLMKPASINDPFRHYPDIPIQLYSSGLASDIETIPVQWVLGHIARYPLSSKLAVVVSLE
jgi:hypothetical protein